MKFIAWNGSPIENPKQISKQMIQEGYGVFAHPFPRNYVHGVTSLHDESLWLIKGQIEVTDTQQTYLLNPGDRLLIPKNTTYRVSVLGETPAYYLLGKK